MKKEWIDALLPKVHAKSIRGGDSVIVLELSLSNEGDLGGITSIITSEALLASNKDSVYLAEDSDKAKLHAINVFDTWKDVI